MSAGEWTSARAIPEGLPFFSQKVTLIRIEDASRAHGGIDFVTGIVAKREQLGTMAAEIETGTRYLVAWTGQHSTDIFKISIGDVTRLQELPQARSPGRKPRV